MKNLTLIKQHPSIQLGHLYEHMFCMEIKRLFYREGLFKYTDFALSGSTFDYGGLIEIEIELYTDQAANVANTISSLSIPTDDRVISTAFNQILAEEQVPLTVTSLEAVRRELHLLEQMQWQKGDNIDVIDSKTIRRQSKPIFISGDRHLPASRVVITLQPDSAFVKSHRDLIPLFRHLTRLLTCTIFDQLAGAYGYYCGDTRFDSSSTSGPKMRGVLLVANGHREEVDLGEITEKSISIIKHMIDSGAATRLVEWLTSLSHKNSQSITPNANESYNETGVYVGAKGWLRIATEENITLLLQNSSIIVKFGRAKVSEKLV